MLQKMYNKVTALKVALATALLSTAGAASAQVDVTQAITDITGLSVSMNQIGTAIISLAVVALGIRWIKATFFS